MLVVFHEKVPKAAPVTPPGSKACHSDCGQISSVVVNISLWDRSRTDANPCAPRLRWLFVVFVCETICATIVILALESNLPPPWEVCSSRFLLGVFLSLWMCVWTLIADFTNLIFFFKSILALRFLTNCIYVSVVFFSGGRTEAGKIRIQTTSFIMFVRVIWDLMEIVRFLKKLIF